MSQDEARQHHVHHDKKRSLSANRRRCSVNVNEDIEHRLAGVGVQISDTLAELVDVRCQHLICVGYSVIQVCHLVVCVASKMVIKCN